jgi:hypothetical protein
MIVGMLSSAMAMENTYSSSAKTAFRQVLTVPANQYVVPTVVEIPFAGIATNRNEVYVEDFATKQRQQTLWKTSYTDAPTNFVVRNLEGVSLSTLSDTRQTTSQLFPIDDLGEGLVVLNVMIAGRITTDALTLELAPNVRIPQYISITTTGPSGNSEVVVNRTAMAGATIRFPEVTTNNLRITVEYDQPLRVTELKFSEKNIKRIETKSLRFLAQPGQAYQVFLDPDLPVPESVGERANLQNDAGVVIIAPGVLTKNTLYRNADRDGDGSIDTLDNCVDVSNPDQADIDGNLKGDACEDFDRDGVSNLVDNCINLPNPTQLDEDGDGIGDVCDDSESRLTEKYAWILWVGIALAGLTLASLFLIVARRDPNLNQDTETEIR